MVIEDNRNDHLVLMMIHGGSCDTHVNYTQSPSILDVCGSY